MQKHEQEFKDREVFVGDTKFYPIHLHDRELETIILNILEYIGLINKSEVIVLFRKDKGGKGIDIRIDSYTRGGKGLLKNRRHSMGINANWEVTDMFDHWVFYASRKEGVSESDYQPDYSSQEIFDRPDLGLEEIIEERRRLDETPVENKWFEKDEWGCLLPARQIFE